MSRDTELAWCAGFFDGEGTTHAAKQSLPGSKPSYLVVQIGQFYFPETLERFKRAVGVGKVYGPYLDGKKYVFKAERGSAEVVLDVLWPHLCQPKKDQATAAREALRRASA